MPVSPIDTLISEIEYMVQPLTSLGSPVGPLSGREKLREWDHSQLLLLSKRLKRMIIILSSPDGLTEEFLNSTNYWLARASKE